MSAAGDFFTSTVKESLVEESPDTAEQDSS